MKLIARLLWDSMLFPQLFSCKYMRSQSVAQIFLQLYLFFGVYLGDMREYLNIIRSLFWMSEDGGPTSFTSEAKSEFLRGMERGEWQAGHLQCLSF